MPWQQLILGHNPAAQSVQLRLKNAKQKQKLGLLAKWSSYSFWRPRMLSFSLWRVRWPQTVTMLQKFS